MAQRGLQTHPLVVRRLEVLRTRDVTRRMRRVTLTGPQLATFDHPAGRQPAFTSPAFDDHVKIVFAEGDLDEALPVQLSHGIEWPASSSRVTRDYTPRRLEAETAELDLDFVLGHDGPASQWAERVQPGAPLWIVGPKSSTVLPDDLDWIWLLGDETALPAIARFLEERPTDVPARVVVTVESPDARLPLATRPGDTVTWIEAPAHDGTALQAAVLDHTPPAGTGYVWAGAESRALLPIRRHLARELGMPKSHLNLTGYWHHREDAAHEARPEADAGPLRWLATRAALRLGVLDAVARGARTEEIAERIGVRAARLAPLLAVLEVAGLVKAGGSGRWSLGEQGEALLGDEHAREEYDGFEAEMLLSLLSLDEALTADVPSWQAHYGRTLHETALESPAHYEELVDGAGSLAFVLDALAADPSWNEIDRAGLTGPGAGAVATALAAREVAAELVVMEDRGPLAAVRDEAGDLPVLWHEGFVPCDTAVAALALEHRTDAEAVRLLRDLGEVTSSVVLVESLRADALGPREADRALLRLAASGAAPRDGDAVARLAEEAGWSVDGGTVLGWGYETITLRR